MRRKIRDETRIKRFFDRRKKLQKHYLRTREWEKGVKITRVDERSNRAISRKTAGGRAGGRGAFARAKNKRARLCEQREKRTRPSKRETRVRVAGRSTAVAKHTFVRAQNRHRIFFFFSIWRSKDQQQQRWRRRRRRRHGGVVKGAGSPPATRAWKTKEWNASASVPRSATENVETRRVFQTGIPSIQRSLSAGKRYVYFPRVRRRRNTHVAPVVREIAQRFVGGPRTHTHSWRYYCYKRASADVQWTGAGGWRRRCGSRTRTYAARKPAHTRTEITLCRTGRVGGGRTSERANERTNEWVSARAAAEGKKTDRKPRDFSRTVLISVQC